MAVRKKKGSGGGGGKNRKINVGKRNKGTGFNAEGVYRIKRAYYGIKPGGENNGRTWAETSCLFLQMEPVGHAGTSFMENALTYKAGNLDNMKPSQCGTHLVPVKKEYDGIPEGSKLDYLFSSSFSIRYSRISHIQAIKYNWENISRAIAIPSTPIASSVDTIITLNSLFQTMPLIIGSTKVFPRVETELKLQEHVVSNVNQQLIVPCLFVQPQLLSGGLH